MENPRSRYDQETVVNRVSVFHCPGDAVCSFRIQGRLAMNEIPLEARGIDA